jgi:hypothetical protein
MATRVGASRPVYYSSDDDDDNAIMPRFEHGGHIPMSQIAPVHAVQPPLMGSIAAVADTRREIAAMRIYDIQRKLNYSPAEMMPELLRAGVVASQVIRVLSITKIWELLKSHNTPLWRSFWRGSGGAIIHTLHQRKGTVLTLPIAARQALFCHAIQNLEVKAPDIAQKEEEDVQPSCIEKIRRALRIGAEMQESLDEIGASSGNVHVGGSSIVLSETTLVEILESISPTYRAALELGCRYPGLPSSLQDRIVNALDDGTEMFYRTGASTFTDHQRPPQLDDTPGEKTHHLQQLNPAFYDRVVVARLAWCRKPLFIEYMFDRIAPQMDTIQLSEMIKAFADSSARCENMSAAVQLIASHLAKIEQDLRVILAEQMLARVRIELQLVTAARFYIAGVFNKDGLHASISEMINTANYDYGQESGLAIDLFLTAHRDNGKELPDGRTLKLLLDMAVETLASDGIVKSPGENMGEESSYVAEWLAEMIVKHSADLLLAKFWKMPVSLLVALLGHRVYPLLEGAAIPRAHLLWALFDKMKLKKFERVSSIEEILPLYDPEIAGMRKAVYHQGSTLARRIGGVISKPLFAHMSQPQLIVISKNLLNKLEKDTVRDDRVANSCQFIFECMFMRKLFPDDKTFYRFAKIAVKNPKLFSSRELCMLIAGTSMPLFALGSAESAAMVAACPDWAVAVLQGHHGLQRRPGQTGQVIQWDGKSALEMAGILLTVAPSYAWKFGNGAGIDMGGISKEFFFQLGRDALSSGIVSLYEGYHLPTAGAANSSLYDLGGILGKAAFVDWKTLGLCIHPVVLVAAAWPWILDRTSSSQPWPFHIVLKLLGEEWYRLLSPASWWAAKEKEEVGGWNSFDMMAFRDEIHERYAEQMDAIEVVAIALAPRLVGTHVPLKEFQATVAGDQLCSAESLNERLQILNGSCGQIQDVEIYKTAMIEVLRTAQLEQRRGLYRFWFGTEAPDWSSDSPPRISVMTREYKSCFMSHTCSNTLDVPAAPEGVSADIHIRALLARTLENQRLLTEAGQLFQIS